MCRFIGVLDFLIHDKHHFKSWHHRSHFQRSVFLCLFQMCVCTVSTHFVFFSIHLVLSIWTKAIISNMLITRLTNFPSHSNPFLSKSLQLHSAFTSYITKALNYLTLLCLTCSLSLDNARHWFEALSLSLQLFLLNTFTSKHVA